MARLLAEMPDDEHKYLKMCCAKIGVSLKDFILQAVIEKVDAWEDIWMIEQLKKEGKWNRKRVVGQRDGKSFCIYEDGEIEELTPSENIYDEEVKNV